MKIIHLSDLHLGKKISDFSMIEDQKYILGQILSVIDSESPDCIIIAGDIYDKSVPSAEAVTAFDDFIYSLSERKLQVFIISGNHDSAERLSFASRIIDASGIHISKAYNGQINSCTLTDKFGKVNFYLLPFIRPLNVRKYFPDKEIKTYNDAVNAAVEAADIDFSERNVIVSHQFVIGASVSESEELSVGGSEGVSASAYDGFDYVALGHIHGPQNVGGKEMRYCGTPLKYSLSEEKHVKSVTVAELAEKGNLTIRTVPLVPLKDMRSIRGTFDELYKGTPSEDYLFVTLTDEETVPQAIGKLRKVYPNIMNLNYDNKRTNAITGLPEIEMAETKEPTQLFMEFYEQRNGQPMSEEQQKYVKKLITEIWGNEI